MTPTQALMLTSAAALLVVSHTSQRGQVEAGEGDMGTIDASGVIDTMTAAINRITEAPAGVDQATAARNLAAALAVIRQAEGTERRGQDPYRICYGYSHVISDLREHPAITGEWRGLRLPDEMCRNAGFNPGCISSAAGAYQIIRGTWVRCRDALGLRDFSAASQDAAAAYLIQRRGALQDVYAGRLAVWVNKCKAEWASLPGNYAKQGQRTMAELSAWYQSAGGIQA